MIDPTKITNFDQSEHQLEEFILFWILAAGKKGTVAARNLHNLLIFHSKEDVIKPFDILKNIFDLSNELKRFGIGCYHVKSKYIRALINSNLNLKTCTLEELEAIPGIGPKTARCFLIHSRPNQKYAGLDTHVLKFLRQAGYAVPKNSPLPSQYKNLERYFLKFVELSDLTVSELDLLIWNHYSGHKDSTEYLNDLIKKI